MDEASRLFYIRRTLLQMLADRGYTEIAEETDQTLEAFREEYLASAGRESMHIIRPHKDDPLDQIMVFFPSDARGVGVKTIQGYCEKMKDEEVKRAILVVRDGLTPFAKQAVAELSVDYKIETFTEPELLVNVTEHILVPKHQVLTEQEKQALLTKYKVKDSQLPRMQVTDPVARYYGLSKGQVVKIQRPSETAGRYITYRIVS